MERRAERSGRARLVSTIGALALVALVGPACGGGDDTREEATRPSEPPPTDAAVTPFTSPVYGYSMRYPSGWTVREAERPLTEHEYPDVDSTGIDYFSETAPDDPTHGTLALAIGVAAPAVPNGTTLNDWATNVEESHMSLLGCAPAERNEDIQIGGEPGRLLMWKDCPAFLLWAEVVHGTHAFHVWLVDSQATSDLATQEADEALFTQVLASLAFAS